MQQWTRQLEPKSPGWFALVVAAAAVVVVFCGSALGLGGEPAVGDAQPLTLTLSAPPTCETLPAAEALRGEYDENGELVARAFGWVNPGDLSVRWSVSGGTAPYRLTIDGQTRDGWHGKPFAAPSGTGVVSCGRTQDEAVFVDEDDFGGVLLIDGEPRVWRHHLKKPDVDSGPKTVRATVTDAAGATAEASVEVYVILELGGTGDRLEGGKTYRLDGNLITVPEEIDLEVGGLSGASLSLHVVGTRSRIALDQYYFGEVNRWVVDAPHHDSSGETIDLHAKFDELIASIGHLPTVGG